MSSLFVIFSPTPFNRGPAKPAPVKMAPTDVVPINPAPVNRPVNKPLLWLGLAIFFGFYFSILGTVPALAGSAAAQWGKLRLFRRDQGIMQTESAEENQFESQPPG
jgi:hypothetical protein